MKFFVDNAKQIGKYEAKIFIKDNFVPYFLYCLDKSNADLKKGGIN